MVKGYWDKRYDKLCESIYLIDHEKGIHYTMEFKVHKDDSEVSIKNSTDIPLNDGLGLLRALSEALQQGGYIPKAATDAELKATKYHLEDMRKLALR